MRKSFKKTKVFGLAMVMVLSATCTLNSNYIQAQPTQDKQIIVQNDNGEDVTVTIKEDAIEVTNQEINSILDDYPDASNINICEIGYSEEEVGRAPTAWNPPLLHTDKIETEKTITVPERVVKDEFIISVARGETDKLSTSWSYTISSSINGEVFDKAKLNLSGSITASYTKEYVFTGPPESSSKNCREYRVKFYREDGKYIQRHLVYYWPSGELYGIESHGGTFKNPTKYLKYSVDKKI